MGEKTTALLAEPKVSSLSRCLCIAGSSYRVGRNLTCILVGATLTHHRVAKARRLCFATPGVYGDKLAAFRRHHPVPVQGGPGDI